MKKKLVIEMCAECPHCSIPEIIINKQLYCCKKDAWTPALEIPDWCPLEDAE